MYLLPPVIASGATTYRVRGERVNVRALPSITSEVVGQVSRKHTLTGPGSSTGEWVEVFLPEHLSVWIHRDLVANGKTKGNDVNLRCGPGLNYRPVGRCRRGEKVEPRSQKGEWTEIAPTARCVGFIHTDYASPVPPPGKKPTPSRKPAPTKKPTPPREAPRPPPLPVMENADGILRRMHPEKEAASFVPACLENVRLVADRDQGTPVALEGTVRLAGLVWRRPSRYRVFPTGPAKPDGIRFYYLAGDTTVLNMLLDKAASIEGRLYHAEGVTEPVVVIESFEYGRTP